MLIIKLTENRRQSTSNCFWMSFRSDRYGKFIFWKDPTPEGYRSPELEKPDTSQIALDTISAPQKLVHTNPIYFKTILVKFRMTPTPKNSNSDGFELRRLSFTRTPNLDLTENWRKYRNFHYKTYRYQNPFHLKRILTEFYIDPIRKNTIPKGYDIGIRPLAGTRKPDTSQIALNKISAPQKSVPTNPIDFETILTKFRMKPIPKNPNSDGFELWRLSFTRTSNLDLAENWRKYRNFHYKTYRNQNPFRFKRVLTEFYIDPTRKIWIPKGYDIGIRPLTGTGNVKLAKVHFDDKRSRNYRNQNPTDARFFLSEF